MNAHKQFSVTMSSTAQKELKDCRAVRMSLGSKSYESGEVVPDLCKILLNQIEILQLIISQKIQFPCFAWYITQKLNCDWPSHFISFTENVMHIFSLFLCQVNSNIGIVCRHGFFLSSCLVPAQLKAFLGFHAENDEYCWFQFAADF